MPEDPETRRQIAKQGRLWLLSLLCAIAGTVTIVQTGSLARGVAGFLVAVLVLGPLLWLYERRRR
ncbi:MAG: hypothetical protein ACR2LI_17835 [Propionibacteriaceae bacterium]